MTQPKRTGAVQSPGGACALDLRHRAVRRASRASRAYDQLQSAHGYEAEDMNIVMPNETRDRYFTAAGSTLKLEEGNKSAQGLATGGAVGGGIGAALAAIFAVGTSVVIPGLGFVVAGPIAAALAGAGAGAATGGLIGALVGAGIPEDRARGVRGRRHDGGVVLGARARDDVRASELERDLESYGGTGVHQ